MRTDASGPGAPHSPARRRWLLAGVAGAAAAAGAGLAWWRLRPGDVDAAALEALWQLRPASPDGMPLDLRALQGRPLIVNFWATWCPPCIEEMPLLDAFHREHSPNGWQVLGLAIDQPGAVRKFLARTPVSFPIALAGPEGAQLARALGNMTGGLPFTVVIGPDGRIRQRRMGRVTEADLQAWSAAG